MTEPRPCPIRPAVTPEAGGQPGLNDATLRWRRLLPMLSAATLAAACTTTPLPPPASKPPPERAPFPTPRPPPPAPPVTVPAPIAPAPAPMLVPPPAPSAVESAAVAARFPDPDVRFGTPVFQVGRTAFTSDAESQAFLRSLVRAGSADSAEVRLLVLGQTQNGTPLEALWFGRENPVAALPAASAPPGAEPPPRLTVLLVGQQHGDEPAASEALLVIAQELSSGRLKPLLDRIDVVVMPRANPDGAVGGQRISANGIDINRDHLLLRTPESRALAKLLREFRPRVVVDAHEYPAAGPYLERLGALPRHDVLLQYAMAPQVHAFVTKAAETWFRQPLLAALKQQGLSAEWFHVPAEGGDGNRLTMGSPTPESLRNTAGLRNAVSLLIETRGGGLERQHFKRRVHTQVVAMSSALREAARRADDLQRLRHYADTDVASQSCRGQVVVEAAPAPTEYTLTMIDPVTGADRAVPVNWDSTLALEPMRSRPRPCGYWLGADQTAAVDALQALGLTVQRLAENGVLGAEAPRPPAAPGTRPRQESAGARMLLDAPSGSFYVSLAQPLANLAVAALEPDTPYSFAAHGLVSGVGRQQRVLVPPEAKMVAVPDLAP